MSRAGRSLCLLFVGLGMFALFATGYGHGVPAFAALVTAMVAVILLYRPMKLSLEATLIASLAAGVGFTLLLALALTGITNSLVNSLIGLGGAVIIVGPGLVFSGQKQTS